MTAALALLLLSATLTGSVTRIIDGDTLVVLDTADVQHRIRLSSIDAPESKQPFGTKSKEALADLVKGKQVSVEVTGRDKYGRELGTIYIGSVNVNRKMLELGMAWHYRRYSKDESLAGAEKEARVARVGLWADKEPVPPWEWRSNEKQRRRKKSALGLLVYPANASRIELQRDQLAKVERQANPSNTVRLATVSPPIRAAGLCGRFFPESLDCSIIPSQWAVAISFSRCRHAVEWGNGSRNATANCRYRYERSLSIRLWRVASAI